MLSKIERRYLNTKILMELGQSYVMHKIAARCYELLPIDWCIKNFEKINTFAYNEYCAYENRNIVYYADYIVEKNIYDFYVKHRAIPLKIKIID